MSGKREKQGVLKKASSFKDELKRKIIRRTPSMSRSRENREETPLSPSRNRKHAGNSPKKSPRLQKNSSADSASSFSTKKSPKVPKRRGLQRGSSFSEGTNRVTKAEKKEQQLTDDIEKIESESRKIFQALAYIRDVVDKNILIMLPGSASIVLETILEIHQLLSNYFVDQESTTILASQSQVHQNLAHLIRWADHILMNGEDALNKDSAHEIINALENAVKELLRLSADKLRRNALSLPINAKNSSPATPEGTPNGTKRNSLPDIPLTPREQKILAETSAITPSANKTQVTISKSADDLLGSSSIEYPTDEPPPKPPLPPGYQSPMIRKSGVIRRTSAGSPVDTVDGPPPLPMKKRLGSQSQDETHLSVASSIQSSGTRATSPLSISPYDTTPLSQSPTSSISSALSAASSEDLLSDSRTEKAHSQSSSQATTPTHSIIGHQDRLSTYDNFKFLLPSREESEHFSDFAKRMNELTTNIHSKGSLLEQFSSQFGKDLVPTVPSKRTLLTASKLERGQIRSQYDNMFEQSSSVVKRTVMKTSYSAHGFSSSTSSTGLLGSLQTSAPLLSNTSTAMYSKTMQVTASQETYSSTETCSSSGVGTSSMESLQKPPPLPPKQRAVHTYMQMLGSYNGPGSSVEFARHSIHSLNFYQTQWYQHQADFFQHMYPRSNTTSALSDISSGQRNSDSLSITSSDASEDALYASIAPTLPPKTGSARCRRSEPINSYSKLNNTNKAVPELPAKNGSKAGENSDNSSVRTSTSSTRQTSPPPDVQKDGDSDFAELTLLDDVDVSDQLIKKKSDDGNCEIRGGSVDALIVHAASTGRHDFLYQEAFLTTYRTFITAKDLIDKLLYRYGHFSRMSDIKKKRLSRNAFALLIRVVDELCIEVDEEILQTLMELEFQLLSEGELMLGRVLRRKVIEQCEHRKNLINASLGTTLLSSFQLTAKQHSLTDFKSELLAEQMTMLDSELFQKIEIPEVLLWSKEQNEEHSPNLTKFTEHFNKMSYWCRTRVLEQEDPKEREKFLMKFIKVMKHLRKLNNFNSYLAILSALDSAPVRRLEWQKQNMEALKEFCQLIDSSSSFRAYRQALMETEPPGIPYIGLILQDLTFIHIGNQDLLPDENINFSKRWQQFNVLDSMRRFKKGKYVLKKHPKVLAYFNNFVDHLCEESLWQISESIKPRGGKKKQESK